MNFSTSTSKQSDKTIDKTINLKNKYTMDELLILLKTDGTKVSAVKINGEIDILNFLSTSLEQKSCIKGLDYINKKFLPYQFHIQYAFVKAIEGLIGNNLNVSERAVYIRTIILELERISSHLELLANIIKSLSFPLFYSRIMELNQHVISTIDLLYDTKNEHPFITIGGVTFDIDKIKEKNLINLLGKIEQSTKKIQLKFKRSNILKGILKETGFLSREIAKNLSLGGPIARSSGVTLDVRKTDPYAAYEKIVFAVPVYDSCDIYGEVMVRLDEIIESTNIIKQLIFGLPSGRIFNKISNIEIPNSNNITRIETPFGELFVFAMSKNGTLKDNPKIFRLISPIKLNAQGLLARLTGEAIENIPLIITSFGNGWE
ncbi:MAG: hypothetical protein FK731_05685 [Asgard group archaeon]|nr:hypothetical protein [Asgard group archaeon]